MTTPGHDGEHGGAMDRIKSVWREALGAREDHHDGGADGGQAWGGQHAPPGGVPTPDGGTLPVAFQGPPRMPGPDRPGGPAPLQSTPRGLPTMLPRDGEHDKGRDVWQAPEPTVAQSVPWQAPRPMSQPINPQPINPQPIAPQQVTQQQVTQQQMTPQPINQRPLPQRSAPQPLPQRSGPQAVPQPMPQPVPQPAPQPLPQWSAPPQPMLQQPVPPEAGGRPPVPAAVDEPDRNDADPPTTLQPVAAAAIDEPTEWSPPGADRAEAEPATADLTDRQSAAPDTTPEPAAVREDANDQELDEIDDAADEETGDAPDPGRTPDVTAARPEPIRRSVWTEPEPGAPHPPTDADRAETPDRPMPAVSPVPAVPYRAPDRLPGTLPSHLPSHITDAAVGAWTRPQNGASTRPRGRHELFDAPYREADSMPDPEPVPSSPSRVAADAAPEAPPASRERFVPEDRSTEYADRWGAVKSEFVDEPREAVRKADALVGELLADIARALAEQRAKLDRGLDTDATSTEDLRQAMHRYREFFDRLLTL